MWISLRRKKAASARPPPDPMAKQGLENSRGRREPTKKPEITATIYGLRKAEEIVLNQMEIITS